MIKIWARTLIDNKLINSYIYESDEDFVIDNFEKYVQEICYHMDIPNPIILIKHIKNYIIFNHAIFEKEDFVEKIYFDRLFLQKC